MPWSCPPTGSAGQTSAVCKTRATVTTKTGRILIACPPAVCLDICEPVHFTTISVLISLVRLSTARHLETDMIGPHWQMRQCSRQNVYFLGFDDNRQPIRKITRSHV